MKQQGFTLIELMIVVAIIGILAAVAIPQYQNYVINSKLSAAASSVSSVELAMANDYQSNGTFPTAAQLTTEGFNITNPANGDQITISQSGSTGQITYTFASQIGTGVPANSSITFTATPPTTGGGSSLSWVAAPVGMTNASAIAYVSQKLNGS